MTDLITELRAALEARLVAEQRVSELRQQIFRGDLPREWTFSHDGVDTLTRQQLGRHEFSTAMATRAQVETQLRDAVRALSFDRRECPLEVRGKATCKLTHETVEIWIHLEQDEPACERAEGHAWAPLMDETGPEDFPGGRKLTEGCPHCDGRKDALWPHKSNPKVIVSYEVPAYPEGWVKRELQSGQRPYVC